MLGFLGNRCSIHLSHRWCLVPSVRDVLYTCRTAGAHIGLDKAPRRGERCTATLVILSYTPVAPLVLGSFGNRCSIHLSHRWCSYWIRQSPRRGKRCTATLVILSYTPVAPLVLGSFGKGCSIHLSHRWCSYWIRQTERRKVYSNFSYLVIYTCRTAGAWFLR